MPQDDKTNQSSLGQAPSGAANRDAAKVTDVLTESAGHLKDDVKHAAGAAAAQAKEVAESKFDAGRDFAAEHLDSVASALRKAGDELRSNDSPATEYIGKAATAVDHVSYYLQTRTLSHMLGDLESFSRREPAIFLGGAFVAGLLGGRFMRSATPAGAGNNRAQQSRPLGALPAYGGSSSSGRSPTGRDAYAGDDRSGRSPGAASGASAQGALGSTTPASPSDATKPSSSSTAYGSSPRTPPTTHGPGDSAAKGTSGASASTSSGSTGGASGQPGKPATENGNSRTGDGTQTGARS